MGNGIAGGTDRNIQSLRAHLQDADCRDSEMQDPATRIPQLEQEILGQKCLP